MRGYYTVEFENVIVTANQDWFELTPATNKPIEIVGLFISQSSDFGDAAEEQLRFRIIRGHTTSGSAGTAATPRPTDPNDGAASFTAEVNNTSIAAGGTPVNLHSESFNIRTGYAMIWTPELHHKATAGDTTMVVRLLNNPLDALSMSGTLYVREV